MLTMPLGEYINIVKLKIEEESNHMIVAQIGVVFPSKPLEFLYSICQITATVSSSNDSWQFIDQVHRNPSDLSLMNVS